MVFQTEPIVTQFKASVDKQSFGDGITYARDTGKKIDQALKAKLELDLGTAKVKLEQLRKDLKATTDVTRRIELNIEVNRAQSQVTELGRKLQNLRNTGDASLSRLQSKFDGIGSTIATAFSSIISPIAVVTGLSVIGAKITSLATNLEQAKISFTTMLGSAEKADSLLKDLSSFAKQTPFELVGIRENAKQLLAMGVANENLIPTMKALGDVAAGLSVPLDRLALAYGQVLAKGRLQGGELKQFTEAGVPLLATLSEQLGKTTGEISKMIENGQISAVEVTKAFETMTGEGGKFGNLMEQQSKTLSGMWSNLVDTLTQLGESIGTKVLPVMKQVVDGILQVTNEFGDGVGQVVNNLVSGVTEIVTIVVDQVSGLINFFTSAYNSAMGNAGDSTVSFGQMVLLVLDGIGNGLKTIAFGATALGKILVTALSYAFVQIETGFKKTVNGIVGGLNKLIDLSNSTFGSSIGKLEVFDVGSFIPAADAFSETFGEIEKDFGKLATGIQSSTDKIMSAKSKIGTKGVGGINLGLINTTGGGGGGGGGKSAAQKAADEEKKMEELSERNREKFGKDRRERERKAIDDQIKANASLKDALIKNAKEAYDGINKEIDKSKDKIEDYNDKIGETKDKLADLQKDSQRDIAERYLGVQEDLADNLQRQKELQTDLAKEEDATRRQEIQYDIDKLKRKEEQLKAEQELGAKNLTPEEIATAEKRSKETPMEKIIRERDEKKVVLEQELANLQAQKDAETALLEANEAKKQEIVARNTALYEMQMNYRTAAVKRWLDMLKQAEAGQGIGVMGQNAASAASTNTTTSNTTKNNTVAPVVNVTATVGSCVSMTALADTIAKKIYDGAKGIF